MLMINNLKLILKKNLKFASIIIKIKFYLGLGLEREAKYIKKNFKFIGSLDVGSNTGYFSNMLSAISKEVFSIEPIKYLSERQKNIFKDKNVRIFNFALGDKKSFKNFYIPIHNDPESSFVKKPGSKVKRIKIIKGDDLIKDMKVDFIKIDVEGFEEKVLFGLKKTIYRFKPLLLVEIEKRHNKNYLKIFKFLNKLNYKIFFMNNKNKLIKIKYKNIKNFINKNQNILNVYKENYINNFFFKR
tara:strand:- start:1179 stop:1907 length:729 start_codon:yes stop_codon:yes gene_type:complete